MAYVAQQVRVTLGFIIPGTAEIAETGFSISDLPTFDAASFCSLGASVAGDIVTAYSSNGCQTLMASYGRLTSVKMSPLGLDGRLVAEPVAVSASVNGGTTAAQPLQITTALTMWSGATIGDANYGRMYLPYATIPYTSTNSYLYLQSQCAALATTWQGFFSDVKTAAQSVSGFSGCDIYIMSRKGSGSQKPLYALRVGNVPDTQRRRRNRVPETYSQVLV